MLTETPATVDAYVLEGTRWASNQPIVVSLQLGNPDHGLLDGETSWNDVAVAAMNIWNPYLGSGVQFQPVQGAASGGERGDHKNSVFFSRTAYGEDFGSDTLAVTVFPVRSGAVTTEADVIVNSQVKFDSYRGSLRSGVEDLRRVLVHEFGHVLGLAHVLSSRIASIMQESVTNFDTVQEDDIAGISAIYNTPSGHPEVYGGSTLSDEVAVGITVKYQIQGLGESLTYQASGLPPGLRIDPGTGLITGSPTVGGTYYVTILLTNSTGTGTATLVLKCDAQPIIAGDQPDVTVQVGQPFFHQIKTTGQPATFSVRGLPPGLNLDSVTGIISGVPTKPGSYSLQLIASNLAGNGSKSFTLDVAYDLNATILHRLASSEGMNPVGGLVQAADQNFYGVTSGGGTNSRGTVFTLTPNGVLTTIHSFSGPDGSSPSAAFVQGRDGNFYGLTSGGGATSNGTVYKVTPAGEVTTLHSFDSSEIMFSFSGSTGPLVVGADGNLYGDTMISFPLVGDDVNGVAFKITPDGTYGVIHRWTANEKFASPLILGGDGNLYGIFGSNQTATPFRAIFQMTPDGAVTTVHVFNSAEELTLTNLLESKDGNFYATTANSNFGDAVFKLTPDGTLTKIHAFNTDYSSARGPVGLVQGRDGNLYGAYEPEGGIAGNLTTLYKLTPDGDFTTIHTFLATDGYKSTSLFLAADGEFYGGLSGSSAIDQGLIFKTALNRAPVAIPTATLAVTNPQAVMGGTNGEFMLSLSAAQTTDVTVNFTIKGTAVNGEDYVLLKATKKIKAGKTSKAIKIKPLGDLGGVSKKTISLILAAGDGYTVGTTSKVKVKILSGQ